MHQIAVSADRVTIVGMGHGDPDQIHERIRPASRLGLTIGYRQVSSCGLLCRLGKRAGAGISSYRVSS